MIENTEEQKAKILVKETKEFYFQIIFIIGLLIFFILRRFFLADSMTPTMVVDPSMNPEIQQSVQSSQNFINQIMIYWVASVFLLMILYRYLKLWNLKRKLKNHEKGDEKLKKYLKTEEIPTMDDVENKFTEDKEKSKKKFKMLLIRIIILDALIIAMNFYINPELQIYDIFIIITAITLFYRYLFVYHLDKKLLSDKWEEKKKEEFLKELRS
ncbi:MAG: 2TM domain-containing protein [Methanobrevibacter sp.]|jgi:hypothetical protein|nr:2TM domain-containing protein [Methanobrevibacter sp.]